MVEYINKICICGKLISYGHTTLSAICFDCIMNKTKISGYIGSGSLNINNDNLK
jgi:hypothetical protein